MSNWCQFCDKEMVIEQSVVYAEGYITCGESACVAAAKAVTQEIINEEPQQATKGQFVIFSTMTPKKDDSWRIVHPKDHPPFLNNEEAMTKLFEGEIANVLQPNKLKEIYYCAMPLDKVLADVAEKEND